MTWQKIIYFFLHLPFYIYNSPLNIGHGSILINRPKVENLKNSVEKYVWARKFVTLKSLVLVMK